MKAGRDSEVHFRAWKAEISMSSRDFPIQKKVSEETCGGMDGDICANPGGNHESLVPKGREFLFWK